MLITAILVVSLQLPVICQGLSYASDPFDLPDEAVNNYPDKEILQRHIVEISHGQAFVGWTNAWSWMFSGNYLYRLNKNIAAGGGAGFQFDWTGIYPTISVNSIFGNKSDGFAFGADFRYMMTQLIDDESGRVWANVGCYYKNFFVKVMPTFVFGWPEEWAFETGYSFNIGH